MNNHENKTKLNEIEKIWYGTAEDKLNNHKILPMVTYGRDECFFSSKWMTERERERKKKSVAFSGNKLKQQIFKSFTWNTCPQFVPI